MMSAVDDLSAAIVKEIDDLVIEDVSSLILDIIVIDLNELMIEGVKFYRTQQTAGYAPDINIPFEMTHRQITSKRDGQFVYEFAEEIQRDMEIIQSRYGPNPDIKMVVLIRSMKHDVLEYAKVTNAKFISDSK